MINYIMRLLRLTTENENCFFENTFNSDLSIKPYSKVALSSFTTQLDNLNMVIDAQNNEISYTVDGDANAKNLTLPNGVYTSSNVDNFWIETTRIFNSSMEYKTNQINRQWRCSINGGRSTFENRAGTVVKPLSVVPTYIYTTRNLISGGRGGGKMKRGGGPENGAYLYIKSPNNKGSSSLRATIFADDEDDFTNSGFVLGYTASNPVVNTDVINPNVYLYGIRYIDMNQPYSFILNGVENPTAPIEQVMPLIGDVLELEISEGAVSFNIYRDGGDVEDYFTIKRAIYDHQSDLFPLLLFVGGNTNIFNIQFTSDPFYNIVNRASSGSNVNDNNLAILPIVGVQPPTRCFLQFNSPDLATILGFKKSRYPDAGFENEANPAFIAENLFLLRDFSESYIVELLNIKLNSMDGLTNGSRSILYVIPQLSAIKEHVVYQVPQLIFLDINNNFEMNLREIKARVLTDTLNQFRCYGLSELVLIIKEKDEM